MGGGIWRIRTEKEAKQALIGLIISVGIVIFIIVASYVLGNHTESWQKVLETPLIEWIKTTAIILLFVFLGFLVYRLIKD